MFGLDPAVAVRARITAAAAAILLAVTALSVAVGEPASASRSDASWTGSLKHSMFASDKVDPYLTSSETFAGQVTTDAAGEFHLTGELTAWGYTDGSADAVCTATLVSTSGPVDLPLWLGEWGGKLYATTSTFDTNVVITYSHKCPGSPAETRTEEWNGGNLWRDCPTFVDPADSHTYSMRLGPVTTGADGKLHVSGTQTRSCDDIFGEADVTWQTDSDLVGQRQARLASTISLNYTSGSLVRANGQVVPNAQGQQIRVALQVQKAGKWVDVAAKRPLLSSKSRYVVTFPSQNVWMCRLVAAYPGDVTLKPSKATKEFSC